MNNIRTIIAGTGSIIPERIIKNKDFINNEFFDSNVKKIDYSNEEIITKFEAITEIGERRYINENQVTSDIATNAAENALVSSGIDRETLDYIIVAHNFGDIKANSRSIDILPSLASRVKEKLGIKNPRTVAYDLIFGCPGWLQGMIQANYFIKSGDAKRIMVIGAESLSRIYDPHDRDAMIYADGAGAAILEAAENSENVGILSHLTQTDTLGQAYNLWLGESNKSENGHEKLLLKMNGRKLYNYALSNVPNLVKECIDKAGISLQNIAKILIHQANAKMDEAILKRIFDLYNEKNVPVHIMPMTISKLGNSSVATVPTLLDLILKNKMPEHQIKPGDSIVLTSVGAGMNINCMLYKLPL